jgi:hypothetical protein
MSTKLRITESQFDKALYAALSEKPLLTEGDLLTKAQIEQIAQKAARTEISQNAKNSLNRGDVDQIARKAVKSYLEAGRSVELENKVKSIVQQMVKSDKGFEGAVVEIAKNVLVQLYKALWTKRSFWTGDLKNSGG